MAKVNALWEKSAKNIEDTLNLSKINIEQYDITTLKTIRKRVLHKNDKGVYSFKKTVSSNPSETDILIEYGKFSIIYEFQKFKEWMIPFVKVYPVFYTTSGFKVNLEMIYDSQKSHYFWKQQGTKYLLKYDFQANNINIINSQNVIAPLYINFEINFLNNSIWEPNQQSKGE